MLKLYSVKNFTQNRKFFKTIFIYILIPILVVFFTSFIMYNYYKSIFQSQIEKNYINNLSALSTTVDNLLMELQNTTLLLSSDSNLYDIFYSENKLDINDSYKIASMTSTLLKFRTTKKLIDSVYIIHKSSNEVLDTSGTYTMENFFTKSFKYSNYDENFWMNYNIKTNFYQLLKPSLLKNENYEFPQTRMVIPFVTSNITSIKSKNMFVINISVNELSKLLDKYKLIPSSKMCIIDKDGTLIASNDTSINNEITTNKDFLSKLSKSSNNIFEYDLMGSKTLVINFNSSSAKFNGFTYIAFIPFDDFYNQIVSVKKLAYIILFSGIFLSVIIAYFSSKRIYKPINNIVEFLSKENSETAIENISEVDYIDNQIKKILASETSLKRDLSIVMPLASEQYLIKILTNSHSLLDDNIKNFIHDNNFNFKYPAFCVIIAELKFTEKYFNNYSSEEYLSLIKCLSKIISNIALEKYLTYVLSLSKNTLCVLVNLPEDEILENITSNIKLIMTLFDYDKDLLTVSVGIGRIYLGFAGMNKSYNEAQKALLSLSPLSSEKINVYTEIKNNYNFQYSINDENKLYNYLIGNFKDETISFLCSLIDKNFKNNPSEENIKKFYLNIYNTILRVLNEKKINIENLMGTKYININSDLAFLSLTDIYDYIFSLVNNLLSEDKANNKANLTQITDYIKEHYAEDLYLEKVAEYFNISDKYLSRLFKESFGMGFHEYLTSLRISKAKDLLFESNLSVTKIGEMVGFTTHSTFFRIFKKYEGINPSQYRKNIKDKI